MKKRLLLDLFKPFFVCLWVRVSFSWPEFCKALFFVLSSSLVDVINIFDDPSCMHVYLICMMALHACLI